MDCEHKLKVLEQEIESLKEENRLLKEKLSSSEKNFDGVSFKEKYAVRILDSLPDMLTVFNHEEMGIEVVSNEETNHVGVSNNDFKGMRMQDMVPKEAYHNIHNNLQKLITIYIIIFRRLFRQVGVLQPIMNWMWTGRFIIMKIVFSP